MDPARRIGQSKSGKVEIFSMTSLSCSHDRVRSTESLAPHRTADSALDSKVIGRISQSEIPSIAEEAREVRASMRSDGKNVRESTRIREGSQFFQSEDL